mmetsp:Transcript_20656/g.26654  ORF Transcript_20656/g.26654 Transcript_20656/m.26654 type:complete len:132 (-) Transcript_20656:86-481(-)
MLAPDEENNSEVRREDQDNINRFARLNARLHAIRGERQSLQKDLEGLDDASTELMMMGSGADGDKVMLLAGEAFLEVSEEDATEVCEKQVEKLQDQVNSLTEEEEGIVGEQAKLKTILYGRFGKSINLEDK